MNTGREKRQSLAERTFHHDLLGIVTAATGNADILLDLLREGNRAELLKQLPERLKAIRKAMLRIEKLSEATRHTVLKIVSPSYMARQVHEVTGKVQDELEEDRPLGLNFSTQDLDILEEERVLFNRVLWRRILQNVITNSQRAEAKTLDISVVLIRHRKSSTEVRVRIEDNGKGIPANVLRKLRSGEICSTKEVVGTEEHGLGVLSIRQQAKLMKGRLDIGKRQKDIGAKLDLYFETFTE